MEMLIEACSALNSTIVDLTVETSIKFYKLVFHVFFPTQIFLQFFFQTYIIYYTSNFLQSYSKICFSHVLHFMRIEHQVSSSWALRTTSFFFQ